MSRSILFFKTRPRTRDFMVFCRQFATMVKAGISFLTSLNLLSEQMEQPLLKEKLRDVAARVEKGHTLADSLRAQGGVFPSLLVNMVEAGEAGGAFDKVLDRLALHFEKQHDLEQKVRSATLYPKFILIVVFLAVIFMLVFVLPAFVGIFENMGVELPALTRFLIYAGGFLLLYWHYCLLCLVSLLFFFKLALRTELGAASYDRLRLYAPFYGPLYRKIIVARFCRTLGTLLGSGVGLLMALELVKKALDNRIVGGKIEKAGGGIAQGQSLAEALGAEGFFPGMVIEMVNVGEETGNLDGMLSRAADYFEAEVTYIVDRLGSMLEPVLILGLAGIVCLIALSVLLPMFEIYQLI